MRQIILVLAMIAGFNLTAQNIQLHYDFGKDRQYLTSTVEMYKPDKWGSTFYFIDMDYGISDNLTGVNMAYFEIARGLKFWDSPFEVHLEYNGGFGQYEAVPYVGAYQINDAWLAGGHYTFASEDFSRIFTLQLMYKYIRDVEDLSFQITGVWELNYFDGKFTFAGFADFWKEPVDFDFDGQTDTDFIFMAEPQLWYNFTKNFSLGSEIEVANNFIKEGFQINPTLGAKWRF
ncbi:MAG: DUF5020 family protein [Bacteroidales bacterium]|nr:DUF5020 family protein [Bacteroidales bacterium]MCF8327290.1 DUF5020 family protein [Bacteroidales bacterium]